LITFSAHILQMDERKRFALAVCYLK